MTTLHTLTRVPTGRRVTALVLLCCAFAAARATGTDPLTPSSTEVARTSTTTGTSTEASSGSLDVPRAVLKYDPASLATDRGAAQLLRRLVAAARKVCPDPVSSQPFPAPAVVQCRADALARAVSAIDSPRLSTVYRANGTRS